MTLPELEARVDPSRRSWQELRRGRRRGLKVIPGKLDGIPRGTTHQEIDLGDNSKVLVGEEADTFGQPHTIVIIHFRPRQPSETPLEPSSPVKEIDWGPDEYVVPDKKGILQLVHDALFLRARKELSLRKKLAIAGSIAASGIVAAAGGGAIENINSYNDAVRRANIPTPEFVSKYEQMLRNLNLTYSLNPDDFGSMAEVLDAQRYFHDTLGIKGERLGIEWDKVEKRVDGVKTYDFSKYKEIIDQWMKLGDTRITFNLGIKTFGWPEQKVPKEYKKMLEDVSRSGGIIKVDSPLAKAALEYEDAFFRFLIENYTAEQLSRVSWQFENEAYNPFGEKGTKVTMSDEYLAKSILNCVKYFPDATYKISSAGYFNIKQIENVFEKIREIDPSLHADIAIGYYTDTPVDTPIGPVNTMQWGPIQVDPLAVDGMLGPFGNDLHNLRQYVQEHGMTDSVSEGEVTPWLGDDFSKPPSTVNSLKLLVLRCSEFLDTSKPFEINLWRLSDLYKARNDPRFRKNIQEMFNFIIMVNIDLKKDAWQESKTTEVLGNTIVARDPKTGELVRLIFPKVE